MTDNLRDIIGDDDNLAPIDDDDDMFSSDSPASAEMLFLGMTPVERMFISIFLFMVVAVLGVALLLATGRIG
jgi:hypothetical protein